jgi:hypothetical protein
MNDLSGQLFITVSQKNKFLLDALVELYGVLFMLWLNKAHLNEPVIEKMIFYP